MAAAALDISVIILTTGNRGDELRAAVTSALEQADIDVQVVVVANGVAATELGLPDDDRLRAYESAVNLGIPGGRNLGAEHATAPLLAFLDDDATFTQERVLATVHRVFAADPLLGVLALRIVDEHGHTAQRHVPRLGGRGADRSGPVTAFLGGASIIRRRAFDDAGRYAAEFVYAMEETDLALRLIDRGWTIRYDGAPAVVHPRTDPSRHAASVERTMRNRVWLAYRNLPAPLAVLYVVDWLALSTARNPRDLPALRRAVVEGWRTRPLGERRPVRWMTVARLTRLGRPPVI